MLNQSRKPYLAFETKAISRLPHIPFLGFLLRFGTRDIVCVSVHHLGVGGIESTGTHHVVRVEREDVDPMAVALKRTAENAVRRSPNFNGSILKRIK